MTAETRVGFEERDLRFVAQCIGGGQPRNARPDDGNFAHRVPSGPQAVKACAAGGVGRRTAVRRPRANEGGREEEENRPEIPAGEPHGLGLLMAEAVFALEGCRCQSLGVQTPLDGIVAAARTRRVDIVALSFSACPGARQVHEALVELREKLPESVRLWAGGSAPALRRRLPVGVEVVDSLSAIRGQLATAPRPLAGNGAGQP
jgi:hypothetical protein